MFNFHTPWKYEKTNGFLIFSRGTKNVTLTWNDLSYTARKVPVFGVFLVRIFPHLDWIWRDILYLSRYSVSLHVQSEWGKIRNRKTPNIDTFHAVLPLNTTHYIRRILSHALTSAISQKRQIMFRNKSLWLVAQLFLFLPVEKVKTNECKKETNSKQKGKKACKMI